MTLLGMDVDGITQVAAQLDGQAAAVQGAVGQVDHLVDQAAGEWFGRDAQQFVAEWQARHRPALVAAAQDLAALSATARRNVAEQQRASGVAGGPPAPSPGGRTADGRLDVRERSATTGTAPKDIPGLLSLLRGAYGPATAPVPGGVSVTFSGTGADRHAIVTVSGTEDWTHVGEANPDDNLTNVENAFGLPTDKQAAIRQAMVDAGVQSSDKVLLVGHSQGGADAIAFASHAANTDPSVPGSFHITGVVTAGAPETVEYPPSSIPVLELRSNGDVVPSLGAASLAGLQVAGLPGAVIGAAVHDAVMPSNVTVSTLPGSWELPGAAHATENYIADSAHITDPAVTRFVDAHRDFFTGAPSATYVYSAQRIR